MIEEEAREYMYSPKAHTGHYTDVQIEEYRYDGFIDGANFVLSKQPEILFDFFIWFRENGEKYIDMSVEKMIEIYIKYKNNG